MHAFTLVRYASHSAGIVAEALATDGLAAGAAAAGDVGAGVVEAAGGATFSSFLQPARTPTEAASATALISLRSILMVSSSFLLFIWRAGAPTPQSEAATLIHRDDLS
ncbi:hypothetical protein HMPREF0004_2674 [Achromobacter piechaudii ATCC 43553]|uniref:Uncharacterized protein n=1 Tax=Achromobacter piechaudii ATCC 43553 TaxID=742159 RepID=D4XB01_9BURK|nr:hypothetical protein HMPREF0004_2674 [Achromobacter piechaudii ATCC 43553]